MGIRIKDIAKEIGVTAPTVSKALNNRPGINKELRSRIKKTAERLGYAPYMTARETGMYDQGVKTIAVIYSRVGQHLIDMLQQGTDKIIYGNGFYELRYTLDVSNILITPEKENELLLDRLLKDQRISGILFAFLTVSDITLAQFHKRKIPTVLLNNYTDYGKCVTINNKQAMYNVIKKLFELGHTQIGLIMPNENLEQVWQDRLNGYKQYLKEKSLTYNPNLIIHEQTFQLENAGFATKQLIQAHPEITAIVYGSDTQAYGGYKALRDMGKKIPDDIAVVGFDDMVFNRVMTPSLSSVHQPIDQMGEMGAKMLIQAIKNKDFTHKVIELKTNFILRGSCLKDYKEPHWG